MPNGREIHPAGTWTQVAPYPMAIAVRPDGSQAVVSSIGFPFALNVVNVPASKDPRVQQLADPSRDQRNVETHAGLAYSPNGTLLYVATGDSGKIDIYNTADWKKAGTIALNGDSDGRRYAGSFAATVLCSHSGRWLFALDQGNWRVVVIDTQTQSRVTSVDTGAYPYAMALSPEETRLYVTNAGLFEYKQIQDSVKGSAQNRGLRFPPYGYPSRAARGGGRVEGTRIPGLGDENSARGSSLWTYTASEGGHFRVSSRLRLGRRIREGGDGAIGGAAPSGVVASNDGVFVALAHEDAVVKVSVDGRRTLKEVPLSPLKGKDFLDAAGTPLRGVMPSGVALHQGRLYVTEAGINAVAVIDSDSLQVLEQIPVGWTPNAVAVSPDGAMLYVVNTKGSGSGPNAGAMHDASAPSYIGSLEYGSLSAITLADLPAADSLTDVVVAANLAALRQHSALPRLKHCFLVIRENRTYDEVLGDVATANGEASLARYGMDGWAEENGEARHLHVTPNLHALVQRYATSDNYYVDGEVSADGHRWVMGIAPTPFFNSAWTSNYGGRRESNVGAEQPGRRAMFGGADAPMPEDEPQFGSLWEHVFSSHKGILNYGEGLEVEGSNEISGLEPEGQRLLLNSPVPKPLFETTDRRYPTFNLGIPDQSRVDEFIRDFSKRMKAGKVPALTVIRLPGDHTGDPRPSDGYPYRASFIADNDLALGRIVEFLSRTPAWKDSAIFVTEDDAQGGVDHVDAHRSLLLVASPWVRSGFVAHNRASMGSITRTIDELLGLGAMNLEDALAGELSSMFVTDEVQGAGHAPFRAVEADDRVFAAAKAKAAHPKSKAELDRLLDMDDPNEIAPNVEAGARLRRGGTIRVTPLP